MCKCQSYVLLANDKTQNPGIPGENYWIYSRFYVIVTSSCISRVSVCCRLLNLSMDNSTVLGFPDASGDYRNLVCKYRTPYMRETLPRQLIGQWLVWFHAPFAMRKGAWNQTSRWYHWLSLFILWLALIQAVECFIVNKNALDFCQVSTCIWEAMFCQKLRWQPARKLTIHVYSYLFALA